MNWPADADGDVLRRLQADGFDLSRVCEIDFNIEFADWPPAAAAIAVLRDEHPGVRLIQPDAEGDGYAQFQVSELLSYDLVTRIQAQTTAAMKPWSGVCESWGVMQD